MRTYQELVDFPFQAANFDNKARKAVLNWVYIPLLAWTLTVQPQEAIFPCAHRA
jgi:hypothetical protein